MRLPRFLREEITWRNVRFKDKEWLKLMDAGVAPRWKSSPLMWLLLRILLAVSLNAIIIFGFAIVAGQPRRDCSTPLLDIDSLSKKDRINTPRDELYAESSGSSLAPFWFIYLTSWGLMMQAIYLNTAVLSTYLYFVPYYQSGQEKVMPTKQPLLVTLAWGARTLALPGSFCITLLFWTLLFPVILKGTTDSPAFFAYNLLAHIGNLLIQFADLRLSYEPYLFAGSYFLMHVYNIAYFGWSLIHYAASVTNGQCDDYIYYFLDWGSPAFAIILFASFVMLGVPFFCALSMSVTKFVRPRAQRTMIFGDSQDGKA